MNPYIIKIQQYNLEMIMQRAGTLVYGFFYVLPKRLERNDEIWYNKNNEQLMAFEILELGWGR